MHSVAWQPKFHSLMSLDAAWRRGDHKVVRVGRPATENIIDIQLWERVFDHASHAPFPQLYICAQLHVMQYQ